MTALAAQPRAGGRQAALRGGEELNVDKQPPVRTRGEPGGVGLSRAHLLDPYVLIWGETQRICATFACAD